MRFVDFFAGVGGFRRGFQRAGMKPVGWVEWDKYATKVYAAIHDATGEWRGDDICRVSPEDIPAADVWTAGFPCQDVSISGKRAGLVEGTRSNLFYEVIRLAKEVKPKWIVLENVKGLLSIERGWGFYRVLSALDDIGYDAEWQVLNTKNFGLPQNRERVFIVAHLGGITRSIFPVLGYTNGKLVEVVKGNQSLRTYDSVGIARCLSANAGGGGAKTGNYFINGIRRSLTARECWRLQGFTDEDYDVAAKICSKTQLYKQAGNAVSTTVSYAIGKRIVEILNGKDETQ